MIPNIEAFLLDRDGVLNKDTHYIRRPEDLLVFKSAAKAVAKINRKGIKVIVITNQSGVARGLFSEEDLTAIHTTLKLKLAQFNAHIDAIYCCFWHPEFPVPFDDNSRRKPNPGMLMEAMHDFNLNPKHCIMIGDADTDILAGKKAGCITAKIATSHSTSKPAPIPDYFFRNLKQAVDSLLPD
jgi:histidinol-phosphate phosphatase family protein